MNRPRPSNFGKDSGKDLCKVPSKDSSTIEFIWQRLKWLNLANCKFDLQGASILASSVHQFENLEVLLLYNNNTFSATQYKLDTTRSSVLAKESNSRPGYVRRGTMKNKTGLGELAQKLAPTLKCLSLGSCALGDTIVI